jgi:signal transduction histidine kinase
MKDLVPVTTPQAKGSGEHQATGDAPFLLSTSDDFPIWVSVALGVVLYLIAGVQVIFISRGVAVWKIVGVESLYLLALVIFILTRRLPLSRRWVLLGLAAVLLLGVALGFTFAFLMSYVIFEVIPLMVVYRFPWRWSLPILGSVAVLFAAVIVVPARFVFHQPASLSTVIGNLAGMAAVAAIAGSLRARAVVIQRLRASEAQLRAEMERTAELAVARERARIARDIHDVLAHSLTVLSIQAQAARQVIGQQPQQAALMLDEMAGMLRESIAESRRVVGLLREATQVHGDTGPLGARLLALAERFAERTGMQCALEETGQAHELHEAQENALQFALQEALTNAYRHGSARHVWMRLTWQSTTISLNICDDGVGQPALTFEGQGGQGLRGMRERATALGGTLNAGPREGGGFEVCLTLPVNIVDANAAGRDA